MELALSALASIGQGIGSLFGIGGSAAGGAAASGTAAATGAASGGGLFGFLNSSPVLSILSGATTAVTALQQLAAGEMKADAAELQAQITRNEAIGERAEGARRAAAITRAMLKTIGENEVAYAASGIDISYGAAAENRADVLEEGYGELAVDRATTNARIAGLNAKAFAYDRLARQYRSGAMLATLATAGEGLLKFARRGVV